MKPILSVLAGSLLAVGCSAALAHDVILVPSSNPGTVLVRYGHPQDWRNVDFEKVVDFQTIGASGDAMDRRAKLVQSGIAMQFRGGKERPSLVTARYDNGYWVKQPAEGSRAEIWLNASPLMVPKGSETMISLKFAKMLTTAARNPLYNREVGHTLELIPQKDPSSLAPGEKLPVLIKFNGKPLPGAGVENSDTKTALPEDKIPRFVANGEGLAMVALRPHGINVLVVDHPVSKADVPNADTARVSVDKVMYVASFSISRP